MRSPDSRSKGNSKQITKTCRKCHKQLPTACKMCSCGFHFRKSSPPTTLEDEQNAVKDEVLPLRSRRTRSKRPQFFDSMEYGGNCLRKRSRLSASTVAGKVAKKSDLADNTNKRSTKDNIMEFSSVSSSISALSNSSESFASTTPASSSPSSSSAAAAVAVAPDNRLRTTPNFNGRTLRENGGGGGGAGGDRPLLLSIILAEINRKYMSVSFRPL